MKPLVMTSFFTQVAGNTVFKISFERRFKRDKIVYLGYGILASEEFIESSAEPDFAFSFTRRNFFEKSIAIRISTKSAEFENIFHRLAEIIVAKVIQCEREQFITEFSLQ